MKNRDIDVEVVEVLEVSKGEDGMLGFIRLHDGLERVYLGSIARRYALLGDQGTSRQIMLFQCFRRRPGALNRAETRSSGYRLYSGHWREQSQP